MNIHQNARLTPKGRALLVRRILAGETARAVAAACGVSERTARNWLQRYRAQGEAGLLDRSCRPHCSPSRTPAAVANRVVALRKQRWTGRRIAAVVGLSPATISRILRRAGLSRLRDLQPAPPVLRYERQSPGELLHLDIKKLGRFSRAGHRLTSDKTLRCRGAGWEFVHVAVDDHTRIAFSKILPDERSESAVAFLQAAVAYYRSLGVCIRRLLTDNGSCYRSYAFGQACRRLGIRHCFTRPYTPRTNGKAERFIQTALREWAYARCYHSSQQRASHLPHWIHDYNWHRPHASLCYHPPISRLLLPRNNLLRLHS
jgi:transposase InsO family protein